MKFTCICGKGSRRDSGRGKLKVAAILGRMTPKKVVRADLRPEEEFWEAV